MSKELLDKFKDVIAKNAFPEHCHVYITDMELDYCTGEASIHPESHNAYGNVHGGVYFTLADTTSGFAARADGRRYVTQQSNMYFISAAKGDMLYSRATVVKRGRTVCIIDTDVTDSYGNLVARGSFNYFCIDK